MLVFKGGMSLDDYLFDVSLKENNGLSFHHHPGGGGVPPWFCPPSQDAIVTTRMTLAIFRIGNPNLNLHLPQFLGGGTTQIMDTRPYTSLIEAPILVWISLSVSYSDQMCIGNASVRNRPLSETIIYRNYANIRTCHAIKIYSIIIS